jgi:hypothetical protein
MRRTQITVAIFPLDSGHSHRGSRPHESEGTAGTAGHAAPAFLIERKRTLQGSGLFSWDGCNSFRGSTGALFLVLLVGTAFCRWPGLARRNGNGPPELPIQRVGQFSQARGVTEDLVSRMTRNQIQEVAFGALQGKNDINAEILQWR